VRAFAGSTRVLIGSPFTVFVTVRHRADLVVNLPANLILGRQFELLGRSTRSRPEASGQVTRDFVLELIAWELGSLQVPSLPLTYAVFGTVHRARTEPISVRVTGVIVPGTEAMARLRDVTAPVPVWRPNTAPFYIAAAVLALAVAGVTTLLVFRRRQHIDPAPAVAPVDIKIRTIDDIRALQRRLAGGDIDGREVMIALSMAVRDYLAERFAVPAGDRTTGQLIGHLPITGAARTALYEWLAGCDLVKYAAAEPSAHEAQGAAERAQALIDNIDNIDNIDSIDNIDNIDKPERESAGNEGAGAAPAEPVIRKQAETDR